MLVFKGNTNLSEKQIETGCGSLLFRITKKVAASTIHEFFGEQDLNGSDKLTVRYNSRSMGQIAVIPSLPIFPLAIACTTGPNHIIAIEDATGKIKTVELTIQLGVNGALKLDGNSTISLNTNFSGLDDTVGVNSLEVYSIDGVPTDLIYMYTNTKCSANVMQSINLQNVNKLVLDPCVDTVDLISSGGYTVNLASAEIEDISQGLNDILALRGKEITYQRDNFGSKHTVKTGIEATKVYTGGTWFPVLGVADYEMIKITASQECYIYAANVANVSGLSQAATQIVVPVTV